MVLRNSTCCGD